MGPYDSNPRRDTGPPWASPQQASGAEGLADHFAGLGIGGTSNDHLFQIKRAVEDAESIINLQLAENNQLRDELLRKTKELERFKSGATSVRSSTDPLRDEHSNGLSVDPNATLIFHSNGTLIVHPNGIQDSEDHSLRPTTGNHHYPENNKINGAPKGFLGVQSSIDGSGLSQSSVPSSRSLSPLRNQKEGEYDPRFLPGHGLLPVPDVKSNILLKQDLVTKVREHEEEILQLRKHLADYSMKEAQIRNEKYVLEKRIAYMRMAFDQQQQDLVDAASKALSYRQDIMEENIRLTYQLQAAQQERSTFVSSLLPLLSEYSLQPTVLDAQSIVSNLKILFRHLQEKLIIIEEKVKESQYQLTPWQAEAPNSTSFPPQSPHSHVVPMSSIGKRLEIVSQPAYSHGQSPISSPTNAQMRADWEVLGNQNRQPASGVPVSKIPDQDNLERTPFVNRDSLAHNTSAGVTQGDPHATRVNVGSNVEHPSFKHLVKGDDMHDSESAGLQHESETFAHAGSGSSPYQAARVDDLNTSYQYLPTVHEERSSSFSEAADDDPLPAIDGLQISGEAFPGRELQACGYSINGTTSCNFEWVRYFENGSLKYIEGAKQPKYLVTADDVDSYLAIEVHPLDNRKRKGELVKVFANDQRKITCDPEMQEQIEKTYSLGHVSFDVAISARVMDIWEHGTLAIKREGYSIKCNGPRGIVATEKFQAATEIKIPYGHPTELLIHCASGEEHLLRTADASWSRDTIVLTMRLFKMRAVEKRKGKKRGLFFK